MQEGLHLRSKKEELLKYKAENKMKRLNFKAQVKSPSFEENLRPAPAPPPSSDGPSPSRSVNGMDEGVQCIQSRSLASTTTARTATGSYNNYRPEMRRGIEYVARGDLLTRTTPRNINVDNCSIAEEKSSIEQERHQVEEISYQAIPSPTHCKYHFRDRTNRTNRELTAYQASQISTSSSLLKNKEQDQVTENYTECCPRIDRAAAADEESGHLYSRKCPKQKAGVKAVANSKSCQSTGILRGTDGIDRSDLYYMEKVTPAPTRATTIRSSTSRTCDPPTNHFTSRDIPSNVSSQADLVDTPGVVFDSSAGSIIEAEAILVDDTETYEEEEETIEEGRKTKASLQDKKGRRRRKQIIIALIVILVLVAIILGVCVSSARSSSNKNNSFPRTKPTQLPTFTPSMLSPTQAPTQAPAFPSAFTTTEELYTAVDEFVALTYNNDTSLSRFFNVTVRYGQIADWDVSALTNFSYVFYPGRDTITPGTDTVQALDSTTPFDMDISGWNMSSAVTMEGMLAGAVNFNHSLESWDTSKVTSMRSMLHSNEALDMDFGSWDVDLVEDFSSTFYGCTSMTGVGLSEWNIQSATDLSGMFFGATNFDADISGWSVGRVTSLRSTFENCSIYNGVGLSSWDTTSVEDLTYMFRFASIFNGDISSWKTGNVTNIAGLFEGSSFSGNVSGWDVSQVTSMEAVFKETPFAGNLSRWNISKVKSTSSMFMDASNFTGDLSGWDVGQVTDMSFMFHGAELFNTDISSWDVQQVTSMKSMFERASTFNSNLPWNVSKVQTFSRMFSEAFEFNGDVSSWDTSACTDMSYLFTKALAFTGDLSQWSTGRVESLTSTFELAINFASDISSWDVSRVNSTTFTFREAQGFNFDISSWNLTNVSLMDRMFAGAKVFNQSLCRWGPILQNSSISTGNTILIGDMFRDTGCINKDPPDPNNLAVGPWCHSCT